LVFSLISYNSFALANSIIKSADTKTNTKKSIQTIKKNSTTVFKKQSASKNKQDANKSRALQKKNLKNTVKKNLNVSKNTKSGKFASLIGNPIKHNPKETKNNASNIQEKQAVFTVSKQENVNDKQLVEEKNIKKQVSVKKASYKIVSDKTGKKKFAVIFINDKEVARYNLLNSRISSENKAKGLVLALNSFIQNNEDPRTIVPGMKNGVPVARAGNNILFTADHKTARLQKMNSHEMLIKWINNIRQALGTQGVMRDYGMIASRSGISTAFSRLNFGKEELGVASWYGGKFHGRRAADGSRFNTHEYTAAHKTLPFGSIVRVTNLKNGKSCIVRINDRGPFIEGRIIDLSVAAAKEIGMYSSGISKVKVEPVIEY